MQTVAALLILFGAGGLACLPLRIAIPLAIVAGLAVGWLLGLAVGHSPGLYTPVSSTIARS